MSNIDLPLVDADCRSIFAGRGRDGRNRKGLVNGFFATLMLAVEQRLSSMVEVVDNEWIGRVRVHSPTFLVQADRGAVRAGRKLELPVVCLVTTVVNG